MQDADDDQTAVFDLMSRPETYGLGGAAITRIDTHGAAVFLAGADVYKVKRAARFSFMDFSTLEKRRAACEAELAVNKANAPELYLGLTPISRENGRLRLGGGEDIVEWAVHLRRFDEKRTLDRLAERGELDARVAAATGAVVAAAHRRAPIARAGVATAALKAQLEETMRSLMGRPDLFPAGAAARLRTGLSEAFAGAEALLRRREANGFVRRCHGDLHLRNIVLIDDRPVLFDALEFDESFATCDVLHDLAFLLMDFWARGLRVEANVAFNAALAAGEDRAAGMAGLAALPLFLSLRAAIRAKVTALEPRQSPDVMGQARRLFDAACAFLEDAPAMMVATGGRSGTGKSRLAQALAPGIGRAPGAVLLRSDVERKRLFGAGEQDRLPAFAYRPEVSPQVYRRLFDLAQTVLDAGHGVLLDAAFLKEEERRQAGELGRAGAAFCGLWLEAPLDVRIRRISARSGDASDADAQVAREQEFYDVGAIDWARLDASNGVEAILAAARRAMRRPE